MILYSPPTIWGLLRGAAINLLLPFVNGLMLGFGELLAHEAAFRLGWSGTKVRRQAFSFEFCRTIQVAYLTFSLTGCYLVMIIVLAASLGSQVLVNDPSRYFLLGDPRGRSDRVLRYGLIQRRECRESKTWMT